MRKTVRIGNIAGVAVGLNWSVLVIFLLITVGLAAGRFPLLVPDLEPGVYAAAGLAAGLIFFASLLAHELGHAIVARRNGVDVEGITLWLFGAVARLEGEPADAGADFRIAAVGPLISVLLGGAFFVLALALAVAGLPAIAVDVFVWLALINVVLAVFNLVPAAPLDGGRILRSLLWKRHGDRMRAAVTAARAGRTFGWLLVALGLAVFLFLPGIGGLWLALIGWFLTAAAGAEEQHARTRNALADVCSLDGVPVFNRDDPLADVLPQMSGCADGRALVTDNGRIIGIVSPTDVMRQLERAELQSPAATRACERAPVAALSRQTSSR